MPTIRILTAAPLRRAVQPDLDAVDCIQSVVAARDLSRKHATTTAILGARMQARIQLTALCRVRPISQPILMANWPMANWPMANWPEPRQHITAMGSDQHHKGGLDPACLTHADLYIPDRLSQTRSMGKMRSAIDAGLISADKDFAERGAIVAQAVPGRTAPDQITTADLTGTGVQDTAIATHARMRASSAGLGTNLDS